MKVHNSGTKGFLVGTAVLIVLVVCVMGAVSLRQKSRHAEEMRAAVSEQIEASEQVIRGIKNTMATTHDAAAMIRLTSQLEEQNRNKESLQKKLDAL